MTIGSKVVASAPVAGIYGTIRPQQREVALSQDVQFQEIEPERQLISIEQVVQQQAPARQLIRLQQRVIAAGTQPTSPGNRPAAAYVTIDGALYPCVRSDSISVSHSEDQASTASVTLRPPTGAVINIPEFQGKSILITTHSDPADAASAIIPLFTGYVDTAKHDRETRTIRLTCSDLRDERLGRESGITELVGGVYSDAVQNPDANARDRVTERMRTVSGGLGYARDGGLRFYEWGTTNKTPALTLSGCDVARDGFETDFLDRRSIVNTFEIELKYRYYLMNLFTADVDAARPRIINTETSAGYVASQDVQTFSADSMVDRATSFSPWETVYFEVTPASNLGTVKRVINGQVVLGTGEVSGNLRGRAIGFKADLRRRVAQPVSHTMTFRVSAAQSIAAYGNEIEGARLTASVQNDFDRAKWEDGGSKVGADDERESLQLALDACYLIGRKEILASHRKNYVQFARAQKIDAIELGQRVDIVGATFQCQGQVVALDYAIADGRRETRVKLACFYLPGVPVADYDTGTAPSAEFEAVERFFRNYRGETGYQDGTLTARAPEIPERFTEEIKTDDTRSGDVLIENTNVLLVNA